MDVESLIEESFLVIASPCLMLWKIGNILICTVVGGHSFTPDVARRLSWSACWLVDEDKQ
jgi:hypothetical protein